MWNEKTETFLINKKYLKEGETIAERLDDICSVIEQYEAPYSPGLAKRFREHLEEQDISLSTPQLSNVGRVKEAHRNTQALPCSCNILTVGNSIADIKYSDGEVAMLSKLGAGVGVDFSAVSEIYSPLDEGFNSNPKLDWVEDLVRTSQKVSQGATRRGYSVPFDSILSDEFDQEALNARGIDTSGKNGIKGYMERLDKNNPDKNDPLINNNMGFLLPTGFRDGVRSGNKEYQRRFLKLLQKRKAVGRIYLVDEENMNKNISPVYEKLGHRVKSTNICCVTGDQMTPTQNGFKTVKELSDSNKSLNLFDNENIHPSSAMLYRGHTDVFKIVLKNGMNHTITSNHDLVIKEGRGNKKVSIDTGLTIGDRAMFQTNKGLFGQRHEPELAFLLGLFLGDGSNSGNGLKLSIWEEDFDLLEEIETICQNFCNRDSVKLHKNSNKILRFVEDGHTGDSKVKRKNLHTTVFNNNGFPFKKGEIPFWIWDADEETHWQLLRGLLYSDGTVGDYNKGKSFGQPINLSLTSIDSDLLRKIQLITANLGINFKIYNFREESVHKLPKNDGTGEYKNYKTKKIERLVLSNKNDLVKVEKNIKFLSRKGVFIEDRDYRDNSKKYSEIISIEPLGQQDVYCPSVDSEKHLWVCNGLVTSNTEVVTPHYDDKSFACIIMSLNGTKWDKIKANPQIIRDAYMVLDIFVELYIDQTKGIPFLEKARRSAMEKRDIGLGLLGFHEYLQSKGEPYGGLGSRMINREIFSTIREIGEEVTKVLAERWGAPKMCQEAGLMRRNVSLMMVAPNKSTAFLMEQTSEGVMPFLSNIRIDSLAGIEVVSKNKELIKLLDEKGKNTSEVWRFITKDLGSVQHLDFLTDHEKSVFKTASEISPKDIIDLAADRQQYIDMAQSINLWNRPNYSMKDIYDFHMYAFDRGIKTLYYYYSQAHAALEKDGAKWTDCESCAD